MDIQPTDWDIALSVVDSGRFYMGALNIDEPVETRIEFVESKETLYREFREYIQQALAVPNRLSEGLLTLEQIEEAWSIAWIMADDSLEGPEEQKDTASWFRILIEFAGKGRNPVAVES
jgi:hypothetical protein